MITLNCDRCGDMIDQQEDDFQQLETTWSNGGHHGYVHFCRECAIAFSDFILELREGSDEDEY